MLCCFNKNGLPLSFLHTISKQAHLDFIFKSIIPTNHRPTVMKLSNHFFASRNVVWLPHCVCTQQCVGAA